MKEFVEKLIGRLEECKKIEKCNLYSGIEEGFGYSHCSDAFEDGQTLGAFNAYSNMLDFIKELAEEYKPKTNAGKIRNMSDEELAEFLGEFEVCNVCKYLGDRGECELDSIFLCEKGFAVAIAKDWLQSEVKGSE